MINPKYIHEQARINILGILYLNIYLAICALKHIYVYLYIYVTVIIKEKIMNLRKTSVDTGAIGETRQISKIT